jgi:hypothetical protein
MLRNNITYLSESDKNMKIKYDKEYIENPKFFYRINELKAGLKFIRYHPYLPAQLRVIEDVLCEIVSVDVDETYGLINIKYKNNAKTNGKSREGTIMIDKNTNYTKTAIAIYGNNPRSMSFFAFKKLDININNGKSLINNFKKGDFAIILNNDNTYTLVKIIDINEDGTKNIVSIFENLNILT